ncbi:hypothetical protein YC2023_081291 [Brassica napus]
MVLRLYDETFSSLSYDELARKYALRRTNNDEMCFLANSSLSFLYNFSSSSSNKRE